MQKRRMRMVVRIVAVALMTCFIASVASAQGGVITLEDTEIKGRIQKPEAFYILQHANLDYELLDTKPSFLGELVESIEEDPF